MILFRNILNELEIRPNIPDPIKRKDLKVGDTIEWNDVWYNINKKEKIREIIYYDNDIIVNNWKEANWVLVYCDDYREIIYIRDPKDKREQKENEQFETIKKL